MTKIQKAPAFAEASCRQSKDLATKPQLPRRAAKANDLHLGTVQRACSIRRCPWLTSSRRTSLRLDFDAVDPATFATFPTTSACRMARTLVHSALQGLANRSSLEPTRRTLPVGRDLLSATADGHLPSFKRSTKVASKETTRRAFTRD